MDVNDQDDFSAEYYASIATDQYKIVNQVISKVFSCHPLLRNLDCQELIQVLTRKIYDSNKTNILLKNSKGISIAEACVDFFSPKLSIRHDLTTASKENKPLTALNFNINLMNLLPLGNSMFDQANQMTDEKIQSIIEYSSYMYKKITETQQHIYHLITREIRNRIKAKKVDELDQLQEQITHSERATIQSEIAKSNAKLNSLEVDITNYTIQNPEIAAAVANLVKQIDFSNIENNAEGHCSIVETFSYPDLLVSSPDSAIAMTISKYRNKVTSLKKKILSERYSVKIGMSQPIFQDNDAVKDGIKKSKQEFFATFEAGFSLNPFTPYKLIQESEIARDQLKYDVSDAKEKYMTRSYEFMSFISHIDALKKDCEISMICLNNVMHDNAVSHHNAQNSIKNISKATIQVYEAIDRLVEVAFHKRLLTQDDINHLFIELASQNIFAASTEEIAALDATDDDAYDVAI
jgi:hypothetical protein